MCLYGCILVGEDDMEMTNKEVVRKLEAYFIGQDAKVIAKLCANAFIDINRFLNFDELSKAEQDLLIMRTRANCASVAHFVTNDDVEIEIVPVSMDSWEKDE